VRPATAFKFFTILNRNPISSWYAAWKLERVEIGGLDSRGVARLIFCRTDENEQGTAAGSSQIGAAAGSLHCEGARHVQAAGGSPDHESREQLNARRHVFSLTPIYILRPLDNSLIRTNSTVPVPPACVATWCAVATLPCHDAPSTITLFVCFAIRNFFSVTIRQYSEHSPQNKSDCNLDFYIGSVRS